MRGVAELLKNGEVWLAEQGGAEDLLQRLFGVKDASAVTVEDKPVPFGVAEIDARLPGGGLRAGALHEYFSSDTLPPVLLTTLLARNAFLHNREKFLLWIGKRLWPSPYLLEQLFRGATPATHSGDKKAPADFLKNCVFIQPPDKTLALWSLETALRSPAVAAVVSEYRETRLALSKRLALAARNGGGLGLLVRGTALRDAPSAAASRWGLRPLPSSSAYPRWELEILKYKGEQPHARAWILEFHYGEHDEEVPVHLSAAVVDQCGRTGDAAARRRAGAG